MALVGFRNHTGVERAKRYPGSVRSDLKASVSELTQAHGSENIAEPLFHTIPLGICYSAL